MLRPILYSCSEGRSADYVSKQAKKLWDTDPYLKPLNLFYLTPRIARQYKKTNSIFKQLLLEHCNPLSQVIAQLIPAKNEYEIQKILRKELKTAWITKPENLKLGKKKYKSNRFPIDKKGNRQKKSNWKECYRQCEIKIIDSNGKTVKF